jgi:predicted RNA-binding Zn-ribbon protein involved in translation (DUF1610 family)
MTDVIECPGCSSKLRVPDELKGQKFRCPKCGDIFVPSGTPSPAPESSQESSEQPPSAPRREPEVDADLAPCPSCGKNIPRTADLCLYCKANLSRRGRDDDEEDEYDDRPWEGRRGPRVRRDCDPHRGAVVLVLGILSTVFGAFTCFYGLPGLLAIPMGIVAWILGASDLKKMNAGTMDPDGRGQTQAGMICGIIGLIVSLLIILAFVAFFTFLIILSGMK